MRRWLPVSSTAPMRDALAGVKRDAARQRLWGEAQPRPMPGIAWHRLIRDMIGTKSCE